MALSRSKYQINELQILNCPFFFRIPKPWTAFLSFQLPLKVAFRQNRMEFHPPAIQSSRPRAHRPFESIRTDADLFQRKETCKLCGGWWCAFRDERRHFSGISEHGGMNLLRVLTTGSTINAPKCKVCSLITYHFIRVNRLCPESCKMTTTGATWRCETVHWYSSRKPKNLRSRICNKYKLAQECVLLLPTKIDVVEYIPWLVSPAPFGVVVELTKKNYRRDGFAWSMFLQSGSFWPKIYICLYPLQ